MRLQDVLVVARPDLRERLVAVVDAAGGRARITGDAKEALDILRVARISTALLDLRVPGVEGHPLLPEVLSSSPWTRVVVYDVSPNADHEWAVESFPHAEYVAVADEIPPLRLKRVAIAG